MTGHPGEWHKKTSTTTLRFLLTENLVVHPSEFWFMDNQVSELSEEFNMTSVWNPSLLNAECWEDRTKMKSSKDKIPPQPSQ